MLAVTYETCRIGFELCSLADVEPWGTPSSGLRFHWFGLTDGWYDLVFGDQHLFRFEDGDPRGINYQVARIWEDLIDIAPAALEELPEPLAARISTGDRWSAWIDHLWEQDDVDELQQTALSWWSARHLDTGHLRGAPRLDIWRRGDDLHVRWRSVGSDGPRWCSPTGDATVGVAAFRGELARFDRSFVGAMGDRVEAVAHDWARKEISLDLDELRQEQLDRSTWLSRALTKERPATDWERVSLALGSLEQRFGCVLDVG